MYTILKYNPLALDKTAGGRGQTGHNSLPPQNLRHQTQLLEYWLRSTGNPYNYRWASKRGHVP
jgi:hypothetical protein